jgi:hypothetical protein
LLKSLQQTSKEVIQESETLLGLYKRVNSLLKAVIGLQTELRAREVAYGNFGNQLRKIESDLRETVGDVIKLDREVDERTIAALKDIS